MTNTHRSQIRSRKIEANRSTQMPTLEEIERAAAMFPNNPTAAAIQAMRAAYDRQNARKD